MALVRELLPAGLEVALEDPFERFFDGQEPFLASFADDVVAVACRVSWEHTAGVSDYEVVVAGGGPVGCWLAAELRLGGVDVAVFEKRAERDPHSKALTLLPRSLELLAMRGIVDRWLETGMPVPSSHFALMNTRLDFSGLDTRFPYALFFPQVRTEALLEDHAVSLGARVLREHEVTAVSQDDDGVTVDVMAPGGARQVRARYVVGCEGGSSPVRKSAGIDFVGTASTLRFVMGDVELAEPPAVPSFSLNGDTGALFAVRLGDGVYRLAPIDLAAMHERHGEPPTLEELRTSVVRIAGTDYGMVGARWLSQLGNATLQASRYREGRMLLAGDSAHLFSPLGGQGLNLGLQDATNLAWKLVAGLRGWGPDGLLDTYDHERHPVGAEVADDTLAQMSLVVNSTGEGRALRRRFETILGTHPSVNRELATRLAGLSTAYPPDDDKAHPLTGRRAPDLGLQGAPSPTLFGLLAASHFVLLDLTDDRLRMDHARWADRLDVVAGHIDHEERGEWAGLQAVLVRPDGYVAWATDVPDFVDEQARAALCQWLDPSTAGDRTGERMGDASGPIVVVP